MRPGGVKARAILDRRGVIDLVAEIMPAAWAMTRRPHQDRMAAVGVSHWAIYGPEPCLHGNWGPARVKFHGNFFEFDPDGDGVFVMGFKNIKNNGFSASLFR